MFETMRSPRAVEARTRRSFLAMLCIVIALPFAVSCIPRMVAKSQAGVYVGDWNRHDIDAVVDHYTPDAELRLPDGSTRKGPAEIRSYFQAIFAQAPDVRLTLIDIDSESVDEGWRSTGQFRVTANGKSVVIRTVSWSRKVDGEFKIYRSHWSSQDDVSVLAQPSASGSSSASPERATCGADRDCAGTQICDQGRCRAP